MDNSLPNGGFPPIKLCNKNNNQDKKLTKERYFSTNVKNINIRKILNSNIKKSVIFDEDQDNLIEEIDEV